MAEPVTLKYRAFISYSHADTAWAKWLQRGLEAFKIDKDLAGRETARGVIPEMLRPIFRDREDFTVGETLPEQTLAALDASNALIVVCSPDSARSNYVNEEVSSFKSRYPDRPVIPLIVNGKPGDPNLECFPPSLKFKVDAKGRVTKKRLEVLAADARDEGDGKDLALAKVIAGLLGLSSDDVFRRAERERRAAARRRRLMQAAFSVLALLVVLGLVGWLNQDYLADQWRWFAITRPYMLTQIRSYALSLNAERVLRSGDTFKECAQDCPEMVVIPAGKFMMGAPRPTKKNLHEVIIAEPFAASKFEVTFEDWDACVAYGDCPIVNDNGEGRGRNLVIYVIWGDAKHYAAWLSNMTGKTYQLLSEAQWEYAARSGTPTVYSFGDDVDALDKYAWFRGNADKVQPVGEKEPNAFGLYDMHGNCERMGRGL